MGVAEVKAIDVVDAAILDELEEDTEELELDDDHVAELVLVNVGVCVRVCVRVVVVVGSAVVSGGTEVLVVVSAALPKLQSP